MTDTMESFSAMLRDALGSRIDPGASSFVEMFAEANRHGSVAARDAPVPRSGQ